MMESFNRTVEYLESTLDGEVEEEKIARFSGYSYAMFRRLFSVLTGTTLSEYLRARKLTEAAIRLRESGQKIIDIAMDFGYDSPDSFGLAFKAFHGQTPTEVRKGKPFRVVSRIQLVLSVKGGRTMNIIMEKKPAFIVAGVNVNDMESSQCPKVWDELFGKYSHERLAAMGNGTSYGICHDVEDCNRINYMACYDVKDRKTAEEMGLEVVEVAAAEYAVVELRGAVPDCIHEGWKYVMEVFFPEQGYRHAGAPDFEVYAEGDMHADDYRMELWIPVVKES